MDVDPLHKQRSSRANVMLAATIDSAQGSLPVKLRNVSDSGALVEGVGLPSEQCEILFRRADVCVPGRVIWVRGTLAGIAFDQALDRGAVLRHVPAAVRTAPQPDWLHRRPGVRSGQLSRQEQRWLVEWSVPSAGRR